MKKWLASATLLLIAFTGIAWSYVCRPNLAVLQQAAPKPHSSAAAHRHFSGQCDRWGSMVLILD